MKPNTPIVHGGGWVTRQREAKPCARFFGFLTLIWLSVSFCASVPFLGDWPRTFGWLEWLCITSLVLLPVFAALALAFLVIEQPRTITEQHRSRDYDIRKLY